MRVLVTRPQPGADATARRLAALGHEAVVMPLTQTAALPASIPPGQFEAVVMTSGAAARHLSPELAALLSGIGVLAVGDATARAAREAGFTDVVAAAGDAAALAALAVERLPTGARVLYLAGKVRTGELEVALGKAGVAVEILEVYDTQDIVDWELPDNLHAAMVHSANGGRAFSQIAPGFAGEVVCISQRAADALAPDLKRRALVAARPDDASMLALLAARR